MFCIRASRVSLSKMSMPVQYREVWIHSLRPPRLPPFFKPLRQFPAYSVGQPLGESGKKPISLISEKLTGSWQVSVTCLSSRR